MAYYTLREGLNNQERSGGSAVMYFGATVEGQVRSGAPTIASDGDVILIGAIPKECIADSAYLDIVEDFSDTTCTIDIGHPTYDAVTGLLNGINVFDTVNLDEWKLKAITLPEDVEYSDASFAYNILKSGSGKVELAIKFNTAGVTLKPEGLGRITFNYNYYGTKATGGFIQ